ncbi:hypothetical protein CRM22_006929, partial [Opisthorchis felineus]
MGYSIMYSKILCKILCVWNVWMPWGHLSDIRRMLQTYNQTIYQKQYQTVSLWDSENNHDCLETHAFGSLPSGFDIVS